MFRSLLALCAAATLLGACGESRPPTAEGPMRPPPVGPFTIGFESGGVRLDDSANATLDRTVAAWRMGSVSRITATGHADTVGSPQSNQELSLRRAEAVKSALVSRGVPADSVVVVAAGKDRPVVKTPDETAEPRNRVVEISLK